MSDDNAETVENEDVFSQIKKSTNFKQLILRRGQLRGELTRFMKFFDNLSGDESVLNIKRRLDNIQHILSKFEQYQNEIDEILVLYNSEQFNHAFSSSIRDIFESGFYEYTSKASEVIAQHSSRQIPSFQSQVVTPVDSVPTDLRNINVESPIISNFRNETRPQVEFEYDSARVQLSAQQDNTTNLHTTNNSSSNHNSEISVKLPFLQLPEFTGSFSEWQRFHDLFKALVHEKESLSNVEKFYYLLGVLKGEPSNIIASIPVSNDGYITAWELLKARYQDKRTIVNSHIEEIMEIPPINRESHTALRAFLNTILKNYRALEHLKINVDKWNEILIYILESKLDNYSKRDWENYIKNNDDPKFSDFTQFLTQRCQVLEKTYKRTNTNFKSNVNNKSYAVVSYDQPSPSLGAATQCRLCKGSHFIYHCEKFKALTTKERYNQIVNLKLCTNCLRFGHKPAECQSSSCKICNKKHNTLLHFDNSTQPKSEVKANCSQVLSNSNIHNSDKQIHEFIILPTALVYVQNQRGEQIQARVLLDSGSQPNFISEQFIKLLQLPVEGTDAPVGGINQIKTNINQRTRIKLFSMHSDFKTNVSCLVIPKITGLIPPISFNASRLNIPIDIKLADPSFLVPSEIDMLLGSEFFFNLLCPDQIKLGTNLPILQSTHLGWIVSGKFPLRKSFKTNVMLSNCLFSADVSKDNPDFDIQKFWSIEEVCHPRTNMSREELECETHFKNTTTRNNSGRFIVNLPLKDNYHCLGDSEQVALKRFYAMERKLQTSHDLRQAYSSFLSEYESLNHMSEISPEQSSNNVVYYMPHHSVQKPESTTTKTRVVFDASCRTSSGLSLNDVLKVGPTIQDDLFAILIRFRKHEVALIGDLTKMYRQILVDPSQRSLQRIFWRNSPNEKLKHFELNTVTYGMTSSSYLATRCLRQIGFDTSSSHPRESEIISNDFYVDDLLTGASNSDELSSVKSNLSSILSSYGFELRKFYSNDLTVLTECNTGHDYRYEIPNDLSVKTLGVSWVPSSDNFEYRSDNLNISDKQVTKRVILSFIARIFDPLGLLGPISIRAKLIIQKLWQLQIDWDQPIPEDLLSQLADFKNEINNVKLVRIPRHAMINHATYIEIHGFSDASETAYAACVYIRSINSEGQIESHLLCSKSRVAPLKTITLPRLELCGSVLASRLVSKCLESLKIQINQVHMWTDTTIVLAWLAKEPSSWKTFVCNRVAEIQRLTNSSKWHYIASEDNPADIVSRGSNIQCVNSDFWLHGPKFFLKPVESWPQKISYSGILSDIPDRKIALLTITETPDLCDNLCCKFSNFLKLIKCTAYCLHFVKNMFQLIRDKTTLTVNKSKIIPPLDTDEIDKATVFLIKSIQANFFSQDINSLKNKGELPRTSKIRSLSPFLDHEGIIRVGGRLSHSDLTFNQKHPFTKLLIIHEHERSLHSGVQTTLSHIRQNYWPINGRSIVKTCLSKCIRCFKSNPRSFNPKMGDLPSPRVTPSRPFLNVGIDYAGPFDLKDGKLRSRKIIKGYVCMFICLATKAVHIELITDLTSNGFLRLLKRFVSRRGLCSDIYTDNGTNFVGSNNELLSLQKMVDSSNFQNFLLSRNINWHFIPAKSPTFGGLWEASVKSCKYHLKRILSDNHLTYEEFYTLLTQIEAVLNSRPLQPLSCDPNDFEIITPSHFLIGHQLTAIPERDLTTSKINYTKRYEHLQQMHQHFWARWSKEYLHLLQQRNKWQHGASNLNVGDLVLLNDKSCPPTYWPVGRIIKTHPGDDGIVRVVTVKTKTETFKRAVSVIFPLPISDFPELPSELGTSNFHDFQFVL